jgi:hypothetical protein
LSLSSSFDDEDVLLIILTGSAAAGRFTKEVVVSHKVYCRLFFYSGQREREGEGAEVEDDQQV